MPVRGGFEIKKGRTDTKTTKTQSKKHSDLSGTVETEKEMMTGSCSGCYRDPLQKYTPVGSGVAIRMMTTTMMMIIMMAMPLFCDAFSSSPPQSLLNNAGSVLPRNKYRI